MNNYKTIASLAAALLLALLPDMASAQKIHDVEDVETSHLWRGLEVSSGIDVANEFSVSDNKNHFSIGAWGAMQVNGDYKEVDVFARYKTGGLDLELWDIFNFSDSLYSNDRQYKYFNYDAHDTGHFLDLRVVYDFRKVSKIPLTLSWMTVLAGRDRGKLNKQNIYSTYVEAAYRFYDSEKWAVDGSVGCAFALNNYGGNDGGHFYGNSAGVNDVRLGVTYKLKIANHPMPVTSQIMWNPEQSKAYFRININLLNI